MSSMCWIQKAGLGKLYYIHKLFCMKQHLCVLIFDIIFTKRHRSMLIVIFSPYGIVKSFHWVRVFSSRFGPLCLTYFLCLLLLILLLLRGTKPSGEASADDSSAAAMATECLDVMASKLFHKPIFFKILQFSGHVQGQLLGDNM